MARTFNPSRLDIARKRRGLTKTELASQAGVSMSSLAAYERGTKQPTAETVARLSTTLAYPADFFFGDDLDEPPLEGSSFRALSTLTARERHRAQSAATLALALGAWIDARFTVPPTTIPNLAGMDPPVAAAAVRSEWGLGERPIKNMVHLLEAHGVRVFSLTDDCADMDAFSFWRRDTPHVFLNTMKSAERGRMDAAHELGHLVLHQGQLGARGRPAEHEANLFASSFLMPEGSVLAEAPRGGYLDQILTAKHRWKVSAAALAHRMHQLNLLSEWQYRSLFIELGREGYRSGERDGMPRETSQLLGKVFAALRDEGVSMADIAAELHLPADELSKLVFGLVLVPLDGGGEQGGGGTRPTLTVVR